jgi:hypothetical protein
MVRPFFFEARSKLRPTRDNHETEQKRSEPTGYMQVILWT